jgi:hypothetical protein
MKYRTLLHDYIVRSESNKQAKVNKMLEQLNLDIPKKEKEVEGEALKKLIARMSYFYTTSVNKATGEKLAKTNVALGLLNQAQLIVDTDSRIARKLYQQARKLFRG